MEPLSLSLDLLQERLGELLVALLLDAQTATADYDPSPLVSGFGQIIEAMQQIETDTATQPGAHAERASALGKAAYQLLERSAQRLLQNDMNFAAPLTLLHTGFADWVRRHGGMPIGTVEIEMKDMLHITKSGQTAQPPLAMTCNTTLKQASGKPTLH